MKPKDIIIWGGLLYLLWRSRQAAGAPGFIKGDVNGDGVVNMGDAIALGRIIAGVDPSNPRADVNGDGVVNQLDVDELGRIILGAA